MDRHVIGPSLQIDIIARISVMCTPSDIVIFLDKCNTETEIPSGNDQRPSRYRQSKQKREIEPRLSSRTSGGHARLGSR